MGDNFAVEKSVIGFFLLSVVAVIVAGKLNIPLLRNQTGIKSFLCN